MLRDVLRITEQSYTTSKLQGLLDRTKALAAGGDVSLALELFAAVIRLPESTFTPELLEFDKKYQVAFQWRMFIRRSPSFPELRKISSEPWYGERQADIFLELVPIVSAAITGTEMSDAEVEIVAKSIVSLAPEEVITANRRDIPLSWFSAEDLAKIRAPGALTIHFDGSNRIFLTGKNDLQFLYGRHVSVAGDPAPWLLVRSVCPPLPLFPRARA